MIKLPRPIAVVGGSRIPFCRINTNYMRLGNLEMLTAAIKSLVDKYNLKGETLGDVAAGAVMKHSRDWSMTREAVLGSGLHPHTPGHNLDRACGTSLSTAVELGTRIAVGELDSAIAAGVDSASDVPIVFGRHYQQLLLDLNRAKTFGQRLKIMARWRLRDLKPHFPAVTESRTGLSMGQHCELMAKEWKLTQKEQDELAYSSHMKAAAAWKEGFYKDLVVPFNGIDHDNNVRPDTSLEKLAKLRPAFDKTGSGTLTAGNSTPLTDGASAVLLASEDWAKAHGFPVQAYITHFATAGVDFAGMASPYHEGLLMAPTYAVANMLDGAGLKLQDFDFYEIHEAFAAQVLATLKAWESEEYCRVRLGRKQPLGSIDTRKLNIKGGSVALGHPFGATGGRLIAGLAKLLNQKGKGRGLISICTGGGMGVTAILER
ncbi:MAG: acetyl-CoA C-acetyltransferase [Gammaproteobacteria bacterium]|nr:acetyl-CoA C-acetyltransferase [Gammaproteobacteria bacterium]MDE2460718.1 acetyl-CoA C-acetyltransferase [Gammaproteobacteria bacterium]